MSTLLITGASRGVAQGMSRELAANLDTAFFVSKAYATALAEFLLSDAAAWISGQVIGLDGGFPAVRPYVKAS